MTTPDQLADNIEAWLSQQPRSAAGNKAIRAALSISEPDYWPAHKILVANGRAIRGMGKGGSLSLVPTAAPAAPVVKPPTNPQLPTDESGWYPLVESVLRGAWKSERGFDELVVEVTARQGRRNTGGKWTRPDLAAVGLLRTKYVPDDVFEVWTFELKRLVDTDVAAVYEALGHARAASHVAVLICCDTAPSAEEDEQLEPVITEATRHGVGIYVIVWPGSFDDWDVRADAEKSNPSMSVLDDFIATQLKTSAPTIAKWFP